ncbi:TatD family hydrolase [Gayadomonas joobiniege]|uniref:TatD family hydrolase n=1 Tax=Gayadomonas joobiniege TaxID=1234606 RepID=UPI00037DC501|nr:TatD family hydrolase [Gayadomonas joobiniege]
MKFFDSHCHLDLLAKKTDLVSVLAQAKQAGVDRFIVPATTRKSFFQLKNLKKLYPQQVELAFGLHPYFLSEHAPSDLSELESELIRNPNIIAVGEIGLDFSPQCAPCLTSKNRQLDLFVSQLKLAKTYQLPVILHHRKSIDVLCKYIKQIDFQYGGVLHAFAGSLQQAEQLVELGFKLGVGGTITYTRAQKTREVIAKIDSEHLLLETDAPDMPICGRQGQLNQPAYLTEIFAHLVKLKSKDKHELAAQLYANTQQTFTKLSVKR